MEFDAVLLSRLQFGFTIAFHIVFPSLTVGLASFLVLLESLWLITKRPGYRRLYRFWIQIFAIAFSLGIITNVAVLYQFGTNWSRFAELTGNVLGPLMGYKLLTTFCVEAPFLGIMLFGWRKLGPGLHFIATCIVAIGALASTFWMVSANSWMQSPAGYELIEGVFYVTRWWDVVFNPTFPLRLFQMVNGSFLTTLFVVVGISALHMVRKIAVEDATVMLRLGLTLVAILAPVQLVSGHLLGVQVHQYQPAKLAAIAGYWETTQGAPLVLFALPNQDSEKNSAEISIPNLGSRMLTGDWNGQIEGLKTWAKEDQPPMTIVFWAFRIMVGIGVLMGLIGLYGAFLALRHKIADARWFQRLLIAFMPAGFIAIIAGWTVAEVGRQPFVIYGLFRTEDALSPISDQQVAASLVAFVLAYAAVLITGIYYITQIVGTGPLLEEDSASAAQTPGDDVGGAQ